MGVRWRRCIAAAGGFMVAAPLIGSIGPITVAAAAVPTFGNPTISGVQGTGFEQDLRIDRSGRVYTSAPGSLSSSISYINRSLDGGQTFKWVAGAAQPFGKPLSCVGGGDSELATDSANNLYFADLTLANFSTARSGNQGQAFTSTCFSTPIAPVDRQWYAVDGNPREGGSLTLTYDFAPNLVGVTDPSNCGLNNRVVFARSPIPFPGTNVIDPSTAGITFGPNKVVNSDPCNEGIMGNDEVFNYGGVKKAFVIHDHMNLDSISMGRCDLVDFSVTAPSGYDNCQDVLVASFPGFVTGANFPTMAIDRAGNIFAVWEQAKIDGTGAVTGDTLLYYSVSTHQGDANTWSAPQQLPTTGLHNNVFAWPVAGDSGRVDVAWYGTPATATGANGPDSVHGDWSLYLDQSLNFTGTTPAWSGPILASEHFVHRGSMFTLIGHQTGDRTLGDFLQLRVGSQGEANISYADSNSGDELDSQAAFVRQNGGPSLYSSVGTVHLPATRFNSVQVGAHAATFDSASTISSNQPNLEMLGSQMRLIGQNLQIKMLVGDLTSLAPKVDAGGSTLVWSTQWKVPSASDPNGGKYFHAYMQSIGGAQPTFAVGENAVQQEGGGLLATYPGQSRYPDSTNSPMVTGSYTKTSPGVITIDVPLADVTETGANSNGILYSATGASMSLPPPFVTADGPNTCGTSMINGVTFNTCIGGVPFNLIDTTPAYDFNPALSTPGFNSCHEGDGDGSIRGEKGGSATFHSDEDRCDNGAQDGEQFNDAGAGESFYSTLTQSVVYDDVAGTVSITGQGVANGNPVTFTILETEATALTAAHYAIILSDGYVNTGDLLTGTIRLA
jgi:hypothetical protein